MRSLAISLILFSLIACSRTNVTQLPPKVVQHEPWHTKGDQATRPMAVRNGTSVTLETSKASLEIPKSWVEWHDQFGNNIHLSRDQLEVVARGDGEWDTEFASVCNAVLPFDRCNIHVGGEGWGKQAVAYSDLQVRIYDVEDDVEQVERRIKEEGISDIKRFSGKRPILKEDQGAKWRRTVLSFDRFYEDYGATAIVDFRLCRFEKRTFVFVFMYTSYDSQSADIEFMLRSFKVQ